MSSDLYAEDPIQSALDIRLDAQQESVESQQKIDQMVDQTRDMVQEFQQATVQLGDLRVYNDQLERLVFKQREELDSYDRQLQNAKETNRSIVPMMLEMLKVLNRFILIDTPFLQQERSMRVIALKGMMDDPEVNLAEKYRRILEAYQIEADYGRTIEAYTGDVEIEGETRSVEFLRVGRVALFYASLDGRQSAYWDRNNRKWQSLPGAYTDSIEMGLRIARKQAPPDLIKIPLSLTDINITGGTE